MHATEEEDARTETSQTRKTVIPDHFNPSQTRPLVCKAEDLNYRRVKMGDIHKVF